MVPESLAEAGVGEVAREDLDASGGEFRGQGLEPIEASGGREHPHAPVQDELADQLAPQPRGGAGDQGVSAGDFGFSHRSPIDSRDAVGLRAVILRHHP